MNRRAHALHARLLVEACGGLEEAAQRCRVGKSQLSDYQSPHGEGFMPADVLADLEAYCGHRVYSRALFEVDAQVVSKADLKDEACEASEAVIALQHAIRLATRDGVISPREREGLTRLFEAARRELADVGHLLEGEA